jgi:hypothetical protein
MTQEDARRQEATANWLLKAFSAPLIDRREVQLLADEVGLGKTFVALATAYSLLSAVRTQPHVTEELGLGRCYRSAIVVVPSGNHALAKKWHQEVEAIRTRCSTDLKATDWFRSRICENAYDLVVGLRQASDLRRSAHKNPCVLICTANVFSRRVPDLGERLRFLAACLFRWWGNKLSIHERYRIVTRAAEVRGFSEWAQFARRVGTANYHVNLWDFRDHEDYLNATERMQREWPDDLERLYEQAPFSYSDVASSLDSLSRTEQGGALFDDASTRIRDGYEEPTGLLPYCKDAAQRRGHAEWYFQGFKTRLLDLYKELAHHLIRKDLPLIIVDEAHHWRHSHRKDCQSFRARLAPIARRLLLLTATPFQLHRDELLEVLSVGDAMEPAIGGDRVQFLSSFRMKIQEAAAASEAAGVAFSREWGSLPGQFAQVDPRFDVGNAIPPGTTDPRTDELARWWSEISSPANDGTNWSDRIPGPLRPFFARARELQNSNGRLRAAMRTLIIRHRRCVVHRRVLIGREYPAPTHGATRPDQHLLHLAPGACIPPHAELAQYLLMKVVADASRGKHRTTLGMDLTGCYTTLWKSKEGARAVEAATAGNNQRIFRILQQLTGYRDGKNNREDHRHPKLQRVLDEALCRWGQGEKTLLFCFRVPTAQTLARLLAEGVAKRLARSRRALLESRGTEVQDEAHVDRAMQQFRRSLTAREGSGIPLFLDRVLLGWFQSHDLPLPTLSEVDRKRIAVLYARAGAGGIALFRGGDRLRLDRVFLNRAIEHVWANRLLSERISWWAARPNIEREETKQLLEQIANEEWVQFRYGRPELSRRKGEADSDAAPTDSVARSSLSGWYDLEASPESKSVEAIEEALNTALKGVRSSLTDTLISGPNLFVPIGADVDFLGNAGWARVARMRDLIFQITFTQDSWEWGERAKVLDAVVRALLREDILLRLPRSVFKDADETWSASILRGLHEPPGGGQLEPLAGRVEEFLRELAEMGPTEREGHLRYAMNPKAEAVVLVTGDSGIDRDAVFNGFNTPLLPDILVCTQVGQEGIDLHRHCRHVVHYDLGWNPATLEQRTGRTDRLGSKAMRERTLALEARQNSQASGNQDLALPGLDIALPYLAGTYDERMYDRLRSRAQTFEILTGGDPSADSDGDTSWLDPDDLGTANGTDYVPLPNEMLEQLRVNLAVEN